MGVLGPCALWPTGHSSSTFSSGGTAYPSHYTSPSSWEAHAQSMLTNPRCQWIPRHKREAVPQTMTASQSRWVDIKTPDECVPENDDDEKALQASQNPEWNARRLMVTTRTRQHGRYPFRHPRRPDSKHNHRHQPPVRTRQQTQQHLPARVGPSDAKTTSGSTTDTDGLASGITDENCGRLAQPGGPARRRIL